MYSFFFFFKVEHDEGYDDDYEDDEVCTCVCVGILLVDTIP